MPLSWPSFVSIVAFVAGAAQGRQVQTLKEQLFSRQHAESHQESRGSESDGRAFATRSAEASKAFAALFLSLSPQLAFAHSGLVAPLTRGTRPSFLHEKRRIGCGTPVMSVSDVLQSLESFVTGGIAGSLGAATVYPVDFVKTRLQNERTPLGQEPKYHGAIDCFTKTWRDEGPLALYQGLLPQVVGVWPEKAIKLTVNGGLRRAFSDPVTGAIALPLELAAGAAGGFSQDIFTNPLEIVKVRLQVADGRTTDKQSPLDVIKELGFSGLYQGIGVCLARDVPFCAIYFPTFAHMKAALVPAGEDPGVLTLLLAGAIAAIPASYLVTPADVIKTRLQVKPEEGQEVYESAGHCLQHILAKEGWQALFKGGVNRVVRDSPQFAVTLAAYDFLNRWVEGLHLL